jgi:hypothetical protein
VLSCSVWQTSDSSRSTGAIRRRACRSAEFCLRPAGPRVADLVREPRARIRGLLLSMIRMGSDRFNHR